MKKTFGSSKKGKGIAAGLAICFVAAIAMVGTYTLKQYKSGMKDELALVEEKDSEDKKEKKEETPSASVNNDNVTNSTGVLGADELTEEAAPQENEASGVTDNTTDSLQETASGAGQINFTEEDKLLWPVDGNVLLSYSMDKTVYFATLDQYKYNSALIISGAVGDQVISATKGIVKSIDVTAQTGTTVTVDLGNGYEAIYGQLKEVPVKVGDYVEAKTVLGYLSEPTKYYSVEGCNLYFQMLKEGQPVNPLEYLEE